MPIVLLRVIDSWTSDGIERSRKLYDGIGSSADVKVVSVIDDEGFSIILLVVRIYTDEMWNHYVINPETGTVEATGRARLEKDSYKMAQRMLDTRV